jgi:hypothetical protein
MGPKIFTVREANQLLPNLTLVFSDLDQVRSRIRKLKGKMDVLEMLWGEEVHSGENPDHREYSHYLEELQDFKADFERIHVRFTEQEVVLKGMDAGLIDFYSVIDGRLVHLCWKRGETAVEHYHHLDSGFDGRLPIPAEELAR